jgi:hypothetical protein
MLASAKLIVDIAGPHGAWCWQVGGVSVTSADIPKFQRSASLSLLFASGLSARYC